MVGGELTLNDFILLKLGKQGEKEPKLSSCIHVTMRRQQIAAAEIRGV